MPTEMKSVSASAAGHSRTVGLSSLVIAATIAIAMLHLVSGVMLDRSHARPMNEPAASAAPDEEATCPPEVRPPERLLAYD
jgi:hypothetical protein